MPLEAQRGLFLSSLSSQNNQNDNFENTKNIKYETVHHVHYFEDTDNPFHKPSRGHRQDRPPRQASQLEDPSHAREGDQEEDPIVTTSFFSISYTEHESLLFEINEYYRKK